MYVEYKKKKAHQDPADVEEVRQYAGFVGGKCARRMLLCRR